MNEKQIAVLTFFSAILLLFVSVSFCGAWYFAYQEGYSSGRNDGFIDGRAKGIEIGSGYDRAEVNHAGYSR